MRTPPRSRRGLTLLELLVLMVIVAILLALLIPSIPRVRVNSRITQCKSNLHGIGIACHNYLATHGSFPSGWICGPTPGLPEPRCTPDEPDPRGLVVAFDEALSIPAMNGRPGLTAPAGTDWSVSALWGWHALLLPEMDVVVALDFDRDKTANLPLLRTNVSSYVCPNQPLPQRRPGGLGYSTYRGSMGNSPDSGMLFMNSSIGERDARDGTSQTILIGETRFGFWGDASSACARIPNPADPADAGRPWADWNSPLEPVDNGGPPSQIARFGFGSWHQDAVNFVFVDASVRSIDKRADAAVMSGRATRADGEEFRDD